MSESVPSIAMSVKERHSSGSPRRRPSSWTSFSATPAPASSREGHAWSSFGSVTGTSRGTSSEGSWWSVTTTSMPAATSSATSAPEAIPLSTVMTSDGSQVSLTRPSASRERP